MKALKILGVFVLGLIGLLVLFYLVLRAINWKDQPPSAAALRFNEIIAARPQVPPAENGVVYTLGFAAPAGQDPREVGARRLAWIEAFDNHTDPKADPLVDTLDMKSGGSPALDAIRASCGEGDRKPCADAFDQAAGTWQPTETETLALQRYREMLALHAWRDAIPLHIRAPLPAYQHLMHAQRVYLVSALQLAEQGKGEAVRDALNADLVYWRGAQRNAQNLIAKMIAVAAIRNHFFFSKYQENIRTRAGQMSKSANRIIAAGFHQRVIPDKRYALYVPARIAASVKAAAILGAHQTVISDQPRQAEGVGRAFGEEG